MKRIRTPRVAEMLDCSLQTVRDYAARGWLTPWTASGVRGKGTGLAFDPGEVEAFVQGGAPAAKAYRESLAEPIAKVKPRTKRRTPVMPGREVVA